MGDLFFIIFILAGLGVCAGLIYYVYQTSQIKKTTLTLDQYIKKYPDRATKHGIRCIVCNSSSIRNWGYEGATDRRRLFICNHCNKRLYRNNDW